jgi:hypothetical protein
MDKQDVKVGMKVVPTAKTIGDSWDVWMKYRAQSFRSWGFVTVQKLRPGYFVCDSEYFRASDFSPATIEVGDTVRGYSSCGVVSAVDGNYIRVNWDSGEDGISFHPMDGFTLIRKARKPEQPTWKTQIVLDEFVGRPEVKPSAKLTIRFDAIKPEQAAWKHVPFTMSAIDRAEQKKEDKPVSKRPRLEDINENYVLKLRNGNMAVAMKGGHLGDSDPVGVYERRHLTANGQCYSGKPSFEAVYGCLDEYVIVATKKMPKPSMAISAVITNTEPVWDWTEDMDKPAFKVGDWVEVVSSPNGWNVLAGEKGTVCETDDTDMPYCVCGIHGRKAWFRANQLKSCTPPAPVEITAADIKAKFGDRVVVKLDGQSIEVK